MFWMNPQFKDNCSIYAQNVSHRIFGSQVPPVLVKLIFGSMRSLTDLACISGYELYFQFRLFSTSCLQLELYRCARTDARTRVRAHARALACSLNASGMTTPVPSARWLSLLFRGKHKASVYPSEYKWIVVWLTYNALRRAHTRVPVPEGGMLTDLGEIQLLYITVERRQATHTHTRTDK